MTGLYLACLVFGVMLVAASAVFGGDEGSHETPHLGEHDELAYGTPWTMALSVRFWTFSAASFGALGILVSMLGAGALATGAVATIGGLGIGATIASLFRWFARAQVSAPVDPRVWVGQEARVILPIRPGEIGKVAIQTAAGREEFPATTGDGVTLDLGVTVLIAHIDHGTANVTALPDRPKVGTPG